MKLNINNKVIEYYRFGQGKKTLVLIPGISLTSALPSLEEVKNAYQLLSEDYEIFLIGMPVNIVENTTCRLLGQDYIEVFKALNLNNINLFGASMGGMISQEIVSLAPNLIKKLILVSTVSGSIDHKDTINKWKVLAINNQRESLIKQMLNDIYLPSTVNLIKDNAMQTYLNCSQEELNRFIYLTDAILTFNSESYLSSINIPTLIISAKGDKVFSYHEGEHLHLKIKNSQFILYDENNGHAVYDEQIDVKQQIYNFIK